MRKFIRWFVAKFSRRSHHVGKTAAEIMALLHALNEVYLPMRYIPATKRAQVHIARLQEIAQQAADAHADIVAAKNKLAG